MIHIVFDKADLGVLQQAVDLDESLKGNIILIRDDYSVGPLKTTPGSEGWLQRSDWWRNVLEVSEQDDLEDAMHMMHDTEEVRNLKKVLYENNQEKVWIWVAQNKQDVSGYYWLISQMADYQGNIFILYLNNLPFFNEKGGIFYPQKLSQIPPKEFLKAKKLARPLTPSEFEIDTYEWQQLVAAGKMVRLLEGGKKLVQHDEDYYDIILDQYIHGDFIKANRVIQNFLNKEKETARDVYLYWRLKIIIQKNGYEIKGDSKKSKREFEVRNPKKPSLRKKAGAEVEDS